MQPFRLRHADRIVAGFLLFILATAAMTLFFVVKGQGLFKRRVEYRTVFKDGGGIAPETPVRIAGIEVGAVRSVRLTDDDLVEVRFEVLEEYTDRLRQDPPGGLCDKQRGGSMLDDEDKRKADDEAQKKCGSRVAASVPAGLGAFLPTSGLIVRVGNRENPVVEPGGLVPADEPEGLNEILARLQKEGFVQSARDIITQVDELLRRVNDEEGPIQKTLQHVEAVAARAAEGKGLVGEITRDNSPTQQRVREALEKADKALADLQKASEDIATVTATVRGKNDDISRIISELEAFSKDARKASANFNNVAEDSKKIPPDVRAAVANLNRRIDDLGAIISGLRNTFPFSAVADDRAEDNKKTQAEPEKK